MNKNQLPLQQRTSNNLYKNTAGKHNLVPKKYQKIKSNNILNDHPTNQIQAQSAINKFTPTQSFVTDLQPSKNKIQRNVSQNAKITQQLFPCKQCGRSFVLNSLKRHEKICKKVFLKKRKQFDSAKQRFATKEQLMIFKKHASTLKQEIRSKQAIHNKMMNLPTWKAQSMALRMAMKQMREGRLSEEQSKCMKTVQKLSETSLFKCRYCGKKFNEDAGKRHQAFCQIKSKDMKNKRKLR